MTTTNATDPGSNAYIHCKKCDKHFKRLEWMTNKVCDNPNCNCPEVKKAMTAANAAIEKAKQTSQNVIKTLVVSMPTARDETKDQLDIIIPPVTVIDVIVPKRKK